MEMTINQKIQMFIKQPDSNGHDAKIQMTIIKPKTPDDNRAKTCMKNTLSFEEPYGRMSQQEAE